jgi:hypothetical protein
MRLAAAALLLVASPAVADDFGPSVLHRPEAEQQVEQGILRPVPLTVELPADVARAARRVLIHYRPWGYTEWVSLEMRPVGPGRYRGAIPCMEVSTVTGDLKYYIRVHDVDGQVIATGASRAAPYRVTIKNDELLGRDKRKAKKCPDPADCPPGLLGCPSARVEAIACKSDADCEGGQTCGWNGYCEHTERRTAWPQVSVQQDFGFVRTSGACSIAAQETEGYACYRADGQQYVGSPILTNEPVGAAVGPTRIVVGYDHLVTYGLSIGVRLGWALRGESPTPAGALAFVPFSAAARVTHWFGDDPFGDTGLRPFVFVTGGYAMFDLATTTHVREDPGKRPYQGGNDLEQELDVYKRAGDGFIGGGGGVAVAFTHYLTANLELGVLGAFPVGAFVLAPSAGMAAGF